MPHFPKRNHAQCAAMGEVGYSVLLLTQQKVYGDILMQVFT